MQKTAGDDRRTAFSSWLRTGMLPPVRGGDGLELKFNPWHDPDDGQFTFAGTGRRYGAGASAAGVTGHPVHRALRPLDRERAGVARTRSGPLPAVRGGLRHADAVRRGDAGAKPALERHRTRRSNTVAAFVEGAGDGLYDVAKDTVRGAYDLLTSNPVTTIREATLGVAGMIDTAIAGEDIPARVQVARAADALTHTSARDLGHAAGSIAGNAVLAVTPGTAFNRMSTLRHLRKARPRPSFDPLEIGWAKENSKSLEPWKPYNDGATGARPGLAPTLMRTMPDGKKRPVKFDGVEGGYVIDRKWSVTGRPHAVAQLIRQSNVLKEHRLPGTWEVRDTKQLAAALKLFRKHGITNIKVRVVEP